MQHMDLIKLKCLYIYLRRKDNKKTKQLKIIMTLEKPQES